MLLSQVPSFFFPADRALHTEILHRSRGVAGSGFRPLSNIPHCCLINEFGLYLNSDVVDHSHKSTKDLWLGRLVLTNYLILYNYISKIDTIFMVYI